MRPRSAAVAAPGNIQRVELQAAGHDHLVGIRAHLDDPARRLLPLHAEAIDVREHAAEERLRQAVARIRSRRDPPVDQHRADARAVAGPQEVGPDLGLHHDEQPRLHEPQRPVDDEAEIERKVEHLVDVLEAVARDLLPGHRRGRQVEAEARVALLELRQQRAGRQHFPDRDRVNPDGLLAVQVEGDRQVPQPLLQAADVLPVAHRLPGQVRRHHEEESDDQDTVKGVHRGKGLNPR